MLDITGGRCHYCGVSNFHGALLLAHVRDGDPPQELPQLLDQRQAVLKVGVELLSVLLQNKLLFENLNAMGERGPPSSMLTLSG